MNVPPLQVAIYTTVTVGVMILNIATTGIFFNHECMADLWAYPLITYFVYSAELYHIVKSLLCMQYDGMCAYYWSFITLGSVIAHSIATLVLFGVFLSKNDCIDGDSRIFGVMIVDAFFAIVKIGYLIDMYVGYRRINEQVKTTFARNKKPVESLTDDEVLLDNRFVDEQIIQYQATLNDVPTYKQEIRESVLHNVGVIIEEYRQRKVALVAEIQKRNLIV